MKDPPNEIRRSAVLVPDNVYRKAKAAAGASGMSYTRWILSLIEKELKRSTKR